MERKPKIRSKKDMDENSKNTIEIKFILGFGADPDIVGQAFDDDDGNQTIKHVKFREREREQQTL